MKHKGIVAKTGAMGAIALLVLVALVGLPTTADEPVCDWEYEVVWPLMAGQDDEVGTVTAYVADGYVHVDYEITEPGWELTDSHVAIVAVDAEDCGECVQYFPVTGSGNPKVGHFPYTSDEFTDHTYEIPVDDEDIAGDDVDGFEPGECLCIATHAVVEEDLGGGYYATQTGWAGDHDFGGKSWAVFFCFKPAKKPVFPTDLLISMYFTHYGPYSYWGVAISDSDLPYGNLVDGDYVGWCVDKGHTMNAGSHTVYLMDPEDWDGSIEWDKINWILNNREDYPQCNKDEVQDAIWHFTDSYNPPLTSDAWDLIDDANEYGDGFVVPPGGVYAVVTMTPQKNIIELDP